MRVPATDRAPTAGGTIGSPRDPPGVGLSDQLPTEPPPALFAIYAVVLALLTAVVATAPVFLTAVLVWPFIAPPLAALAVWCGLRGRSAAGPLGAVARLAVAAALVFVVLPPLAVTVAMAWAVS